MAKKKRGIVKKPKKQRYIKWAIVSIVALLGAAIIIKFAMNRFYRTHPIVYKGFEIALPYGYGIHGIDVSRYQTNIDWEAVKKMRSRGVQLHFAFIKATEGVALLDPRFRRNWEFAQEHGVIRGAYHFFRCNMDAEKQAKNFIQLVQLERGDMAPVIDIETTDGVTPDVLVKRLNEWLKIVEEEYGVKPIIYTNAHFYERYLGEAFDEYPLWVAHYFSPEGPRISRPWQFWQHSERGRVNGVRGYVDFNVFNGDEDDFEELRIP